MLGTWDYMSRANWQGAYGAHCEVVRPLRVDAFLLEAGASGRCAVQPVKAQRILLVVLPPLGRPPAAGHSFAAHDARPHITQRCSAARLADVPPSVAPTSFHFPNKVGGAEAGAGANSTSSRQLQSTPTNASHLSLSTLLECLEAWYDPWRSCGERLYGRIKSSQQRKIHTGWSILCSVLPTTFRHGVHVQSARLGSCE